MGSSVDRRRWWTGVVGTLLSVGTISVVVVEAQFQTTTYFRDATSMMEQDPIRDVRLQSNSTNYDNSIEGTVQVRVDNRGWIYLSSNSWENYISATLGEVLCRQLGHGKYRGVRNAGSIYGETIYEANLICNGHEHSLHECTKRYPLISYGNFYYFRITCAESNCAKVNGRCMQVCHNNPVDPTKGCACFKGYVISEKNLTECVDVDECLVNNGGCERGCVNTIGSYRCTCPTYAFWDEKTKSCVELGSTVLCNHDKMTAVFLKEAYPMLHTAAITLLDHSCRARENTTHLILETKYDECMTTREATSGGFKYSNVITGTAKDGSAGHIEFSSLIHISFSCLINKTATSGVNFTPEPVLIKSAAQSVFEPTISLSLCNDAMCPTTQRMTHFKQADIIYARLSLVSQDYDLKFTAKECEVGANNGINSTSVLLIRNGTSNVEWVKVIEPSGETDFVFRFPAFTLGKSYTSIKLKCTASLTALSSSHSSNVHTQMNVSSTNIHLATNPRIGDDHPLIYSCNEAKYDGVYRLVTSNLVVKVWCDVTSADGPWLTFMRRTNGGLNFTRTWKNYEDGFGSADGEFWLGNKFLHLVTKDQAAALRIILTTFSNVTSYSDYGLFRVADSLGDYRLTIDQHSGPAGDMRNASGCLSNVAFKSSSGFSTYDRDNDNFDNYTCAKRGGGWWYFDCNCTCLTCGPSINGAAFTRKGMLFYSFNDLYVLKASEMKLRFPRLAQDSNATQHSVKYVNSSTVTCSLEEMAVALERSTFDQPAEHNLTVNSDSFISQSRNATHHVLMFKLRGMDTTRQVRSDFIDYQKKVSIGPQLSRYYSQLDMTMLCSAKKEITGEQSYIVLDTDVEIQLNEKGFHRVNLHLYTDDALKSPLGVDTRLSEGTEVYVKAVPVHLLPGSRLSIKSCSVRGISNYDHAIRIIQNRCPVAKDVHMMAPDSFWMRAFSLKDSNSINIQCEVETCSADNADCFAACDESLRKRRSARSVPAIAFAVSQRLFLL